MRFEDTNIPRCHAAVPPSAGTIYPANHAGIMRHRWFIFA